MEDRLGASFLDDGTVVVTVNDETHHFPTSDAALRFLGDLATQRGADIFVHGDGFDDLVVTATGEWFNPTAPDVRDVIPASAGPPPANNAAPPEPQTTRPSAPPTTQQPQRAAPLYEPGQPSQPQGAPTVSPSQGHLSAPPAEPTPQPDGPLPPWLSGLPASATGWSPASESDDQPTPGSAHNVPAVGATRDARSTGQSTGQSAGQPTGRPTGPAERSTPPWSNPPSSTNAPRGIGGSKFAAAVVTKKTPRVSPWSLVAVAAVVAILAVGYFGIRLISDSDAASSGQDEPAPASATPSDGVAYVPALAPDGYTTTAVWSADLAEGSYPIINAAGHVATVSDDNEIAITNPSSGEVLHSSPNDAAPATVVTFNEDGPGFAWLADGALHRWTEGSGETTFDVPADAGLYGTGTGLMLWVSGSTAVSGVVDGELVTVTIPTDTTPMGVADGVVFSSSGRLPLWGTPLAGGAPTAVALEGAPEGAAVRRWVGLAGQRLIVAWTTGQANTVAVHLHDPLSGQTVSAVNVAWPLVESAGLAISQDKQRSGVGPVAFDGAQPVISQNEDVQVRAFGDDTAYGLAGESAGTVSADGSWQAYPAGTAVPIGNAPDGEAIVRVGGRAYALSLAAE